MRYPQLGDMQFVETSNPIDLTTWGIADFVGETNAREITDALRAEFDEDPPHLSLVFEWAPDGDGRRGKAATDPVMMYVDLPLGKDEDHCSFACSLEEVVADVIDLHKSPSTGKVEDEQGRFVCRKIAARLRELADKLENACA